MLDDGYSAKEVAEILGVQEYLLLALLRAMSGESLSRLPRRLM